MTTERPGFRHKGRAYYYDDPNARPRRWIPLGRDEDVAIRRYEELRARAQVPNGTVAAMLRDYLRDARNTREGGKPLAAGTVHNYNSFYKHLVAVFGHMLPENVSQADIVDYLDACPRYTGRCEISLLSMAYTKSMRAKRLTFNPCFGVKIDGVKKSKRDRLYTNDELDAIIAAGNRLGALREGNHAHAEILGIAIELAYATGLRIADVCRLRFVDFERAVNTQKTKVRQAFRMTDDLRSILDRARGIQTKVASLQGYVVCDNRGRPMNPDTLREYWTEACNAAGVEDAHFHDIRATAATELDRRGGDATRFLGHKQRQTTERYLRDKRANVVEPLSRKRAEEAAAGPARLGTRSPA